MVELTITAFAGGVGGARMADGLAQVLDPGELTVIVNVGDDFEHFGLKICPDLDTVCYTLAGLENPETGWGRADETWITMETASGLGGPAWFRLGDRDLGLHLERTRRLEAGQSLSEVTRDLCDVWGITSVVLPVTDDPVPTWIETDVVSLPFQEYFVRLRCEPAVTGFQFAGVERSKPAPGVLQAIRDADALIFCPSNPWVSIDPILAVPGVRTAVLEQKELGKRLLAVSPIIGGKTVKGPAAKMYQELGIPPSALAVSDHYQGMVTDFILDTIDSDLVFTDPGQNKIVRNNEAAGLEASHVRGQRYWVTAVMMKDKADRARLAAEILDLLRHPLNEGRR